MNAINHTDSTPGTSATPGSSTDLTGQSINWLCNADLLAQAALSTDHLTRELACRYAAALAFLYNESMHFSPSEPTLS